MLPPTPTFALLSPPVPPRPGFWPIPRPVVPAPVLQLLPVANCSRPPGHPSAGSSRLVAAGASAGSPHHPQPWAGHFHLLLPMPEFPGVPQPLPQHGGHLLQGPGHSGAHAPLLHGLPQTRAWLVDASPKSPGTMLSPPPAGSQPRAIAAPAHTQTHGCPWAAAGWPERLPHPQSVRGVPSASQYALSTHCHLAITTAPLTRPGGMGIKLKAILCSLDLAHLGGPHPRVTTLHDQMSLSPQRGSDGLRGPWGGADLAQP